MLVDGHDRQLVAPPEGWYWPLGHGAHSFGALLYVPGLHATHVLGSTDPAGHFCCPEGQLAGSH